VGNKVHLRQVQGTGTRCVGGRGSQANSLLRTIIPLGYISNFLAITVSNTTLTLKVFLKLHLLFWGYMHKPIFAMRKLHL
jgi:hypothetical protein